MTAARYASGVDVREEGVEAVEPLLDVRCEYPRRGRDRHSAAGGGHVPRILLAASIRTRKLWLRVLVPGLAFGCWHITDAIHDAHMHAD